MTRGVKTQTGKRVTVKGDFYDIIGDVKVKIQENKGILPEQQELILRGGILEKDQTLSDYIIQN